MYTRLFKSQTRLLRQSASNYKHSHKSSKNAFFYAAVAPVLVAPSLMQQKSESEEAQKTEIEGSDHQKDPVVDPQNQLDPTSSEILENKAGIATLKKSTNEYFLNLESLNYENYCKLIQKFHDSNTNFHFDGLDERDELNLPAWLRVDILPAEINLDTTLNLNKLSNIIKDIKLNSQMFKHFGMHYTRSALNPEKERQKVDLQSIEKLFQQAFLTAEKLEKNTDAISYLKNLQAQFNFALRKDYQTSLSLYAELWEQGVQNFPENHVSNLKLLTQIAACQLYLKNYTEFNSLLKYLEKQLNQNILDLEDENNYVFNKFITKWVKSKPSEVSFVSSSKNEGNSPRKNSKFKQILDSDRDMICVAKNAVMNSYGNSIIKYYLENLLSLGKLYELEVLRDYSCYEKN